MDPIRFSDVHRMLDQMLGSMDGDEPAARRRRRIVEVASELFLRHGYRRASVDQIAERAGIAKGTVYLYFKNKADILVSAIAVEKRRYLHAIQPILDGSHPARERLRLYLRRAIKLLGEMPLTSKLLTGDREIRAVLADLDADARASYEKMQLGFLVHLLDPAAAPHRWNETELEDRARVLLALIYALGSFSDARGRLGLSIERFSQLLADIIVDGIAAPAVSNPEAVP